MRAPPAQRSPRPSKRPRDPFWPCTFVPSADDAATASIILSELGMLEHLFGGREASGYAVASWVKKKLRAEDPALLRRVRFDPEGSMFSAYGTDLAALARVAGLLRAATGRKPPTAKALARAAEVLAAFEPEAAEALLVAGYVQGDDESARRRFLAMCPEPPELGSRLRGLHARSVDARFVAARRLDREARTTVRSWRRPLAYPQLTGALIDAASAERDARVHGMMIRALHWICDRHLPDLRATDVFVEALGRSQADTRSDAVAGLGRLYRVPWERVAPLLDDRVPKVRESAARAIARSAHEFPSWMFHGERCARDALAPTSLRERVAATRGGSR
jgi:Immunity protein 51